MTRFRQDFRNSRNAGSRTAPQKRCKVRVQDSYRRASARAAHEGGRDGDMGRGRQKAKDAKIARELKYTPHGADLRELERELIHSDSKPAVKVEVEEEIDPYARWAEDDD